jgi:hypothetical protein
MSFSQRTIVCRFKRLILGHTELGTQTFIHASKCECTGVRNEVPLLSGTDAGKKLVCIHEKKPISVYCRLPRKPRSSIWRQIDIIFLLAPFIFDERDLRLFRFPTRLCEDNDQVALQAATEATLHALRALETTCLRSNKY